MTTEDSIYHAPIPGLVAAADYSSTGQFRAVRMSTTAGQVVLVSAIGQDGLGVLQNDPASGQAAEVARPGGITKAMAGAAVAAGDRITVDAVGRFIPLTTANATPSAFWGYAASAAGAAGELFSLFLIEPRSANVTQLFFPIDLAEIPAGNIFSAVSLAGFVNGGKILRTYFTITDSVTTAGDGVTINLELGGTNVTGGDVVLTSATAVLPNVIAGSAITAANVFTSATTMDIEGALTVGAFAEGTGTLVIEIQAF